MTELEQQLKRHEGLRLRPYKDTVGKLTIGIGRNLDDVGISEDEALFLLGNDITKAMNQLDKALPWVVNLDRVRYDVLVNMAFNMGINGLLQFKNTLLLIRQGKYEEASIQMLNSKWAKQVGNRAKELSEQLKTGNYGG